MNENERQLIDTLEKIAEMAAGAANHYEDWGNGFSEEQASDDTLQESKFGCTIKSLPKRLLDKAAKKAIEINPVNNVLVSGSIAELDPNFVLDPQFLTLVVGKYWGTEPRRLTVSFMESTPADLQNRIIRQMNAWSKTGGISFVETRGIGEVRISREGSGYWSYLGTDILQIPKNRPTMNLQGFTMNTPETEFIRVVQHETGHTLGFPHEHLRRELVAKIDPDKAYKYFQRTQGWDRKTVDQQVLTALDKRSIMGTPPDQTSIMCYRLPGSITRNGKPILGGTNINRTDYRFVSRIYPKPKHDLMHEHKLIHEHGDEWDESEDVEDV
ncbi:hypothetical protein NIES4106_59010 (plasmid) [Fischerella sp. NIES-4106]|nr:hypothetical protein NIES4106_59010 [Fischerella sp. NIES-4106]